MQLESTNINIVEIDMKYNQWVQNNANKMKGNKTKSEILVEYYLREWGINYKSQYIIKYNNNISYIADFIINENTIIEVDGYIHNIQKVIENDIVRQNRIEELGYKVLRIKNENVSYLSLYKLLNENNLIPQGSIKSYSTKKEIKKNNRKIEKINKTKYKKIHTFFFP